MKKILSLFLSLVMIMCITVGIDFSAYADEPKLNLDGNWIISDISESTNIRYYKIILNGDGFLELSLMHYFGAKIQLYNDDLSECILSRNDSDGTADEPKTNIITGDISKGIYYVKITGYLGWSNPVTGKFKLKGTVNYFMNNEIEPNDYDNAMTISCGKIITGAITIQDSIDWYKIVLNQKCKINIQLKHYFGARIMVYNKDLSNCIFKCEDSSGTNSNPKTNNLSDELSKGVYYVKIDGYLGWSNPITGKYQLSFNYKIPVSQPAKFRVTSRNTTNLKLVWNKVSGVSGYQLQRKSGNSWKTVANTTSTSSTVKSLKAGTAYTFRVRAYRTINGTKYYSGWRTLTTPTKPATVSFSSLKAGKKKFTAKWKKTACTGYQLQYSTSSKFKGAKTVTVGKNSTTSKTVSKLKAKKKYYVRVRAYKTVNGTKCYGAWSKAKTVKTKK